MDDEFPGGREGRGAEDADPEARDLRSHFVREAKRHGGPYRVERETAQRAFTRWTYPQLVRWASGSGLSIEFVERGALKLSDPEAGIGSGEDSPAQEDPRD